MPFELLQLMIPFAPLFSKPVFAHAQVLVMGAILAIKQRTVTATLRVMGLSQEVHFQTYHRVLNRAVWSGLQASRVLLGLLVHTFAPHGPVVFGLDDTIERRRGAKIQAKGIYRDPVRSSHSHFVKASGLRWLSAMLLAPIPWAGRVWALPVLTALAPSERYYQARGRRPKLLTDWARQLVLQLARWLPDRQVVVVGDNSFAALELLAAVRQAATMVTRLRLDAALHAPVSPRQPGQLGRPRVVGPRVPKLTEVLLDAATCWQVAVIPGWYGGADRTVELASATAVWYHTGLPPVPIRWVLIRDPAGGFEPQALLCTDLMADPAQIVAWFVQRWPVEVTFEEVRAHLGMETQRQWSDLAIARTTPALLGLFSLVTLLAHRLLFQQVMPIRQAAWYQKTQPTFADALAMVRRYLWQHATFQTSHPEADVLEIPRHVFERLTETLCYAA
jgi:hypothetical protein